MDSSINQEAPSGAKIDMYSDLNQDAFPNVQQQEQAEKSQIPLSNTRSIDMNAMNNPYKNPGATFSPGSVATAKNMFGEQISRQAVMNMGTPLEGNAFTKAMADTGGDYEKAQEILKNK